MKAPILLLGLFAIALLLADRALRIQPMLEADYLAAKGLRCPDGRVTEPFQSPVETLNVPCGVTFSSCPAGSTCGNGFCITNGLRPLKEKCPLPVLP